MNAKGNGTNVGGVGCAVCPVPEQVYRLEARATLAERDMTAAAACLREVERRLAEHLLLLGRAIADLQEQVSAIISITRRK